jgi:uncharacterized damage-inducible protein DinB
MHKEVIDILVEKAEYNVWANKRIVETISKLTLEQLVQKVESSFSGIYPTIFHIWNAENIWLERIKGISLNSWPNRDVNDKNNLEKFIQTSKLFLEFLEKNHSQKEFPFLEISYSNLKGDVLRNNVYEIVLHCLNHSSYHRGQIVTMLRQLGVTDIPSTDFITYLRGCK